MSDEDVTNYLRMQVAAAIQRQIEAALCGTDDEVHAARRASGGWKT